MSIFSKYFGAAIILMAVLSCNKETVILETGEIKYSQRTIDLSAFGYEEVSVTCESIVTLDAGVANASYLWTPGGETTKTIILDTTSYFDDLYTVEITTIDSVWTDSVHLYSTYFFYLPNVFSPNNDGSNDVFRPLTTCLTEYKMTIFNTSNTQKIFESRNFQVGWDGTYDGEDVKMGEYPYRIEVTFGNGQGKVFLGTVQLIR